MKDVLYIIGSGGHAMVIARAAEELGLHPVFVSNNDAKASGIEQVQERNFFQHPPAGDHWHLICGVGSTSSMTKRNQILEKYKPFQNRFKSIIHPTAIVDSSAMIEPGAFIGPGAIVCNHVKIGSHAIINTGATIEHETEVGTNSHVASGAILLGETKIAHDVHVGAGSTVLQGVKVGSSVVIGASALCNREIPANSGTWVGIPARSIVKRK